MYIAQNINGRNLDVPDKTGTKTRQSKLKLVGFEIGFEIVQGGGCSK